MKQIEQLIFPLVQTHFPDFYRDEGARFVDFVKEYYRWMETEGQAVNASRNLLDYRNIDTTSEEFITYFKNKYFAGIPFSAEANTRFLIKHATDIYKSKGTERGVQLVIEGLFNQTSQVYLPGDDILKTSDGTWVKPTYLEITVSERTKDYVGKEVVGTVSQAKAFLESLVTRRIAGKYQQVAYLSNVRGNFTTGELITTTANTVIEGAPVVIGSMSYLTVVAGGADFAVGDIFEVASINGKQGKARVTSVSSETGKVSFKFIDALTSGGWGYSLAHANVLVSEKVLILSNINNANAEVTSFERFETLTQPLINIAYTSARGNNNNFEVGAVVENFNADGTVNANGYIVVSNKTTSTTGYIIVSPITGNLATIDTTFAVRSSNQVTSTFNPSLISSPVITTTSAHSFSNGDLVRYHVLTGNTAVTQLSTGTAYYVVNTISGSTALKLANTFGGAALALTAGSNETGHQLVRTLGTAVIDAYDERAATGVIIGSNSTAVGVVNISSNGFLISNYANVVGLTSNTTATVANVSSGTDATFSIGRLTDTESVFLSPDFINNKNTGNIAFYTIRLDGSNSNVAANGYGFPKFPGGTQDAILLDVLRLDATTIGSIASITAINPGNDYNFDPFVTVVDTYVSGYNKRDYNMQIANLTGNFVVGEQIQQTYDLPATQLTVNTFSGTHANGTTMSTYVTGEFVYQSNGTANVAASGYVLEAAIDISGAGSLKVRDVTGTFVATSNTLTKLRGLSSGSVANISAASLTTTATTARAIVKEGSNTSILKLKRINLENTFDTLHSIVGRSSGSTANVVSIGEDSLAIPVGLNANIVANVQTSNNVVRTLDVYDSGFGYVDQEVVTLTKADSVYSVTAIVELGKQGVGEGFYTTTRGFLDADKKLQDNEYYQEYSYEVQTKIPFDQYFDVLKRVTHVAGTKAFGKVISVSEANLTMTAINSIVIS